MVSPHKYNGPAIVVTTRISLTGVNSSSFSSPTMTAASSSSVLNTSIVETSNDDAGSTQPSPAQRMISACIGSLLTSLLATPLDVVKTRLQSQTVVATPTCAVPFTYTNNASAYEKLCTCCREVFFAPEHPHNAAVGNSTTAVIRQNIVNALANSGITQSTRSSNKAATSKSPSSPSYFRQSTQAPLPHSHHHNHNHNHTRTGSRVTAGCGPSIIQQHQEGTVIGMKATKAQQLRLEQLAANCIGNNHAHNAAHERYFHGTWDGVKKIVRYEGATSLWRGLSPTVAMSIPATVIYFVGYDYLKVLLSDKARALSPENHSGIFGGVSNTTVAFAYEYMDTLTPLLAGGFARTVAATVISPLELFRTRMQSVHTATKGNSGLFRGVSQGIVAMVRAEGVLSLWRGLGPTLWRDVPFSAIYWMGYENIKKQTIAWDLSRHPQKPVLNEFEIAFTSGALSGMIAATLTTPFDVAKTRRQVDLNQPVHTQMSKLMQAIVQEEGYRGLWRGLTARVAKVAPSCAIMISSYEIGKKALSEHWWGLGSTSSPSSSSGTGSSASGGSSSSSSGGNGRVLGAGGDDRMVLLGAGGDDRMVLLRAAATTAGVSAASSTV
ncbi:hypothetical protein BGZ98_006665 [Dissophora globulifera]|nr:hypothetical protein BGZ98_006665 [Dissophora globulifera]